MFKISKQLNHLTCSSKLGQICKREHSYLFCTSVLSLDFMSQVTHEPLEIVCKLHLRVRVCWCEWGRLLGDILPVIRAGSPLPQLG